ncbi:MAG: 50S ribosomal protein L3 [Candidatus Anstonellales archaeon]
MTDIRKPAAMGLAFRPRSRAKKQLPRATTWKEGEEARIEGFIGYKAGMCQVAYPTTERLYKGREIVSAATVLEVPPMVLYGIRGYKGGKAVGDELCTDEAILKKIGIKKRKAAKIDESKIDNVRALVYAEPSLTGIGKKHIERAEFGVGGKDLKEKINFLRSMLGKQFNASDVFKKGEYIDIIGVTKGKGMQGTVKRHGTAVQRRKATGKRRHVGTLGQWHPAYVFYTIPRAGQMGYHKRTELNKVVCEIGKPGKKEYKHYGKIKNDVIVVLGSVMGPVKRAVKMRRALRKDKSQIEVKELIW